jgi:hypothetical protein
MAEVFGVFGGFRRFTKTAAYRTTSSSLSLEARRFSENGFINTENLTSDSISSPPGDGLRKPQDASEEAMLSLFAGEVVSA